MIQCVTWGVIEMLQTLKKGAKMMGKKDISSNLVWNPLTMSMTMTITMGGSKNVTNSEKGAKMVGRKRFILKLSMELIGYKHDHDYDYGG